MPALLGGSEAVSAFAPDPGDLTPDEMYGHDQDEAMGNEAGTVLPLIVHAADCDCEGDYICLGCAVEDDAAFAVFCKRTGMNPNQQEAA
jgi:hypothetical protein